MNINEMMSLALVFMLPCGDLDIECINIDSHLSTVQLHVAGLGPSMIWNSSP